MTYSTVNRLRGRKLQTRRKRFFARHPLCVSCEKRGKVAAATELDHIVALVNGGTDARSNWQGLCSACHDLKTRKDLGHKASGGCDADGLPSDPDHPWYKG